MSLIVDSVAPFTLRVVVDSDDFDLSTASAVSVDVKKPDGSMETWAASITASSTAQLTMEHTFLAGDLDAAGTYTIEPMVTLPAGTISMDSRGVFSVREKFA